MSQLISVIVPVYNVYNYLEKCIQTLINQTYKELEIILVDDGSTDGSGELCEQISKRDKRIKVIHKKNGGLSSARNAGLDVAKGDFISFVDSDDSIHLCFYSVLMNIMEKTKADIVQSEISRVLNQKLSKEKIFKFNIVSFTGEEALQEFYKSKITVFKSSCNKLFKKKLFQELRYPEGKIFEDRWIAAKLYYACEKVIYLNIPLYYYTVNPNSIMHLKITEKHYDTCMLYLYHYIYFLENGNEKFADIALKQYYISLLNLRYNFLKYTNIYKSNKKKINFLFKRYKKQFLKGKNIKIYEKIAILIAWYFQFLYNAVRDLLDFYVSNKRGKL